MIQEAIYRCRAAVARVACWWITAEDRRRVAGIIDEASALVEDVVGRRPDMGSIPVEPLVMIRPDPRLCYGYVAINDETRRMRLCVNFSAGQTHRDHAVLVFAHELAHVVHEQARGDISLENEYEAERFAFVVTDVVSSRLGLDRTYSVQSDDYRADPHWRAWKWSRDRPHAACIAWARDFIGAGKGDGVEAGT